MSAAFFPARSGTCSASTCPVETPADLDRKAAAALRQSPTVEEVARVIHAQVAATNADELIHHPSQKSWEGPTMPRWAQWEQAAQAIDTLYKRGGGE